MLGSLFGLGKDLATIVTAPVEIAIDLTRVVTKPVADVAKEITTGVKDLTKDD